MYIHICIHLLSVDPKGSQNDDRMNNNCSNVMRT
jgi:hypothetical protein